MTEQHDTAKEDPVSAPNPNPPVEEVEVEFRPGQTDDPAAGADFDQKPDETKAAEESPQSQAEILDTIVPMKDPKTWLIGPEDVQRTFVQKPLSFIGKMQWFSLVGEALDKALSGPNGMSLNSLFETPNRGGVFKIEDFRDADMFVQAIGKLLSAAPDFLVRSYLIWLNVPDYDRDLVAQMMQLPPDEGGLSDEQGMQIIETFLDQNYADLADFFGERLSKISARVSKLNKERESRR